MVNYKLQGFFYVRFCRHDIFILPCQNCGGERMNVYRVIFAKNEILSIKEVNSSDVLNGLYCYEHKNGMLLYAMVKAKTEDNALTIAMMIIKEVRRRVFGTDYVD